MRSLLSRSVRPTLGHSVSSGRSATRLSVRKAGFPPIRKQFTFCDAFTILLAPVFTAAFVVEQTRKERRRQAWDRKIAEVQAETEAIRCREVEAWTRIQRRSIRHGLHGQRRSFATAAAAPQELEDDLSPNYDEASDHLNSEDTDDKKPSTTTQLSDAELAVQRRWARLISIRLALQMLIHIRIGDSEGFKQPPMIPLDSDLFPQGMDELVEKLRQVKGLMRGMAKQPIPVESLEQTETSRDLHTQITRLSELLRTRQVNVPTFVSTYSNMVAKSSEGFSTASLRLLMLALSGREQPQMASFVAGAMWESAQLLSEADIRGMLGFYAQHMDALRIQKLLKRLTRNDSFPRPRQPWTMVSVDGMQLAVPRVARHLVLERLIQATLKCKQVDFASAYAKVLHQDPSQAYCRLFVVNSFLSHYTDTRDWTRGVDWLRQAKIRVTSAVAHGLSEERLGLTILCMLDLCKTCGQEEEYNNILDAAVSARIGMPLCVAKTKSETRKICTDWMERGQLYKGSRPFPESLVAKVSYFQEFLAKASPDLMPYVGIEDPYRIAELETGEVMVPTRGMRSSRQMTEPVVRKVVLDSPSHRNFDFTIDLRNRMIQAIGWPFPVHLYRDLYKLGFDKGEANHSSTTVNDSSMFGKADGQIEPNWRTLLNDLISWRSVYVREDPIVHANEIRQDESLNAASLDLKKTFDNEEESKLPAPKPKISSVMNVKVDTSKQRMKGKMVVARGEEKTHHSQEQEDEGYFSDDTLTFPTRHEVAELDQSFQRSKQRSRIGHTLPPPDYGTNHFRVALTGNSPGS